MNIENKKPDLPAREKSPLRIFAKFGPARVGRLTIEAAAVVVVSCRGVANKGVASMTRLIATIVTVGIVMVGVAIQQNPHLAKMLCEIGGQE